MLYPNCPPNVIYYKAKESEIAHSRAFPVSGINFPVRKAPGDRLRSTGYRPRVDRTSDIDFWFPQECLCL